jgi:hypothetical protein
MNIFKISREDERTWRYRRARRSALRSHGTALEFEPAARDDVGPLPIGAQVM